MNAPIAGLWLRQSLIEVREVLEPVPVVADDLMKIRRVGEWPEPLHDGCAVSRTRRHVDVKRRAQLDASDADSRLCDRSQRSFRILVFNGEMTAVEADPDVLGQQATGFVRVDVEHRTELDGAVGEQATVEERQGLIGCFNHAIGLWLDIEMDEDAAAVAKAHERRRD